MDSLNINKLEKSLEMGLRKEVGVRWPTIQG
jgi:hypothetical protein